MGAPRRKPRPSASRLEADPGQTEQPNRAQSPTHPFRLGQARAAKPDPTQLRRPPRPTQSCPIQPGPNRTKPRRAAPNKPGATRPNLGPSRRNPARAMRGLGAPARPALPLFKARFRPTPLGIRGYQIRIRNTAIRRAYADAGQADRPDTRFSPTPPHPPPTRSAPTRSERKKRQQKKQRAGNERRGSFAPQSKRRRPPAGAPMRPKAFPSGRSRPSIRPPRPKSGPGATAADLSQASEPQRPISAFDRRPIALRRRRPRPRFFRPAARFYRKTNSRSRKMSRHSAFSPFFAQKQRFRTRSRRRGNPARRGFFWGKGKMAPWQARPVIPRDERRRRRAPRASRMARAKAQPQGARHGPGPPRKARLGARAPTAPGRRRRLYNPRLGQGMDPDGSRAAPPNNRARPTTVREPRRNAGTALGNDLGASPAPRPPSPGRSPQRPNRETLRRLRGARAEAPLEAAPVSGAARA